jgi:DNA (cytosine-5)-methyltransferase 1
MYCIDLFAGAGGLSTGLELAGFKCLYANEISPVYAQTLAASHPAAFVETGTIRAVDAGNVRRALQLAKGELHLLAGGPPCQGFSVNAPVRSSDDERNHLFRDYLRFVEEFEPRTILIENVPGMISFEKGRTVTEILESLRNLGYATTIRILYAPHFGVPQMRWRAIILGNRFGIDPALMYPVPTHKALGRANFTTKHRDQALTLPFEKANAHALRPHVSVWDAIGDLPQIENGGGEDQVAYPKPAQSAFQIEARRGSNTLTNHRCAGLGKANLVRLPHIPQGGSWRDIPFDLLPKGMQRARRSDHTKRYGRLHPDELGSTILTKCDPHWGTYIHPHQDRVLSVREAARLQSFPDKVEFVGSLTDQYEQVGNAVPPAFAKAIGNRIAAFIDCFESGEIDQFGSSPWTAEQLAMAI